VVCDSLPSVFQVAFPHIRIGLRSLKLVCGSFQCF